MSKYVQSFKMWLSFQLAYPARVIIWFFYDTVVFLAFPFIWLTVYGSRNEIHSMTRTDIVLYYILVGLISTAFISKINPDIRIGIVRGDINKFITKPFHFLWNVTMKALSYRFLLTIFAIGIFFFFIAFQIIPTSIIPNYGTLILFFISLLLVFCITHTIEFCIGMVAFWMGETKAADQAVRMLNIIFSGQLAPLIFFPAIIQNIGGYLPFQYMFTFPIMLFLNKMNPLEIMKGFIGSICWFVGLFIFMRFLWRIGMRQYDGSSI